MLIDRSLLRATYRMDEEACLADRIAAADGAARLHGHAAQLAGRLIEGARARDGGGIDAFLATYGLGTEEGIALMCLAEALLRVPDAETADALIHDKLAPIDWAEHLGASSSTFVNAATFSLMLSGQVLRGGSLPDGGPNATLANALRRAVGRMGEPVIRQATLQAMRILGGQFVFGRTIDEALKRARPERERGLSHSFDMLGEAAMTYEDAERYRAAYAGAIARLAQEKHRGVRGGPGISVKLSALYPRYDFLHAHAARTALVPILTDLARQARDADIHLTVDAEEAERLELSMDIIEAVVADDDLFATGWDGFGLALQAYQKRALPLCDWVAALARRHGRRLMVRLVKGAYWDSEIKLGQVGGYRDYPVFTRKLATDVSYLACAERLLAASDCIYPAFATHNAYTIAAVKALAAQFSTSSSRREAQPQAEPVGGKFEFQRLHGMGEDVYAVLAGIEGDNRTPVRIYAPVGGHKDLLAYLVRRLLENGANSSFVNRMADADVPVAELTRCPVADLAALSPRRNPAIPLPANLFPGRRNSDGVDLADPTVRHLLLTRLHELGAVQWTAGDDTDHRTGSGQPVTSPQDRNHVVGHVVPTDPAALPAMAQAAHNAQDEWDELGGMARADILDLAADLFEAHTAEFISLCQREAGKTLVDAVLELREAVDFLRYYAAEARALFAAPMPLPGPTGEDNLLHLHGRGVFGVIAPWNFPLAIFTGMTAAALAAGNAAIAKPAEQTPLIAALAVRLLHEAGVPPDVLHIALGDGMVGAALTAQPQVCGVAFTGSTATARAINRSLAMRDGPIARLIAETGGQNAMIVDSSALPEQVTRDVIAAAFQSAGQRCSAARVLFVQEDVADTMLTMIRGAFDALVVGEPADLATDVGPVIDGEARDALIDHIAAMRARGFPVWQNPLPESCANGTYVAPAIIEVDTIADVGEEHFGPVLHVCRFPAGGIGQVISQVNATGYGLTLGVHSRIASVRREVEAAARVGNIYVNRNQIGAVVGSQPFGGEGLSGTGPKAGGPHYLLAFAAERVTCVDTTAAGGNASLLASG
jgi:RHH-type proline utilization regulon transcriptional repressor/proline dehydrogenase/delta 1-pyrroline-5-carboxylate dehydrogenase